MSTLISEEIKQKTTPILKESGVLRSYLFGSFTRGDFHEKSDVDILIEFDGHKSLLDLVDLKIKLEDVLDRKVDLLTFNSLSPLLKPYILKDQFKIL